ncbi:hypothetical protein SAMN05428962_2808 [Paenibacillus sp. BC26]|nr:hypothetical protein SAMN05428962_2808 [Paenibacillus sp. BC26]
MTNNLPISYILNYVAKQLVYHAILRGFAEDSNPPVKSAI